MRFSLTTLLAPLLLCSLTTAQVAPGGGAAPVSLAPTQFPVSTSITSLVTIGGTTTGVYQLFVQTFAATALGSWDLGPTPRAGVIGLGDIQGEVGKVKTKRAVETPAPAVPRIRGVSD